MADVPIVYTLTVCPACDALRAEWGKLGIEYDERMVDQRQDTLEEALDFGESVPIIVYPDGRVVEGFDGEIG